MITEIQKLKATEVVKGFKGRFVHTSSSTIAFWEIEEGSILPEHSHIHEQTTHVVRGKLELTIDGKTHLLTDGMIATIPSHAVHSGKAITKCELIDTFCPVREDYNFD